MVQTFETVQPKKRKLQTAAGGVVTIGDATPPVELYSGPTGRRHVKEFSASGEGKS